MNIDIAEAIKHARYNEAVLVKVADGEVSRDIILVASLDRTNGGTIWNNIADAEDENENSDSVGLMRHIRTKRWVFPMLNDHRRNVLYNEAIRDACQKIVADRLKGVGESQNPDSRGSKEILRVLDIGSGTGLLAMMAARHLQEALDRSKAMQDTFEIQVTSVEMSSAMATLAKQTVQSNGLASHINVIEGHSCEVSLGRKASFCTSELLESSFFGEGILPAIRDAWARHLEQDAIVVPQRARIFAKVLESDIISQYWGPHNWLSDFPEGRILRLCKSSDDDDVLLGGGSGNGENVTTSGIRIPLHAGHLWQCKNSQDDVRFLSDTILVLTLDFTSRASLPGPDGQSVTTQFIPIASGRAQGVLFWWELDLGDDLTYSTGLEQGPWQDHWHQCLFVVTRAKEKCAELVKGQPGQITSTHDDLRISFDVKGSTPLEACEEEPPTKRRCRFEEVSSLISPQRAFQLNDVNRTRTIQKGVQEALKMFGDEAMVLDLSDFSLCAMIAALQGACCVTSLETSSGNLPMTAAYVAQVANRLPIQSDNPNAFQIVQCHPEQLSKEVLGGKQAKVVLAEPYYELLEGWHLQEALNYFFLLRSLRNKGLIADNSTSVPFYAAVMGCAIESQDIRRAYKACNPILCGFNHDVINTYGDRFHHYDLSLPMWQYTYTRMTENFEIARINYLTGDIANNGNFVRSSYQVAGECIGLVTWIDYGIVREGSNGIISTDGRPYHQLLRLLQEPVTITEEDVRDDVSSFCCRILLDTLSGAEDNQFEIRIEKK